MRLWQRSLFRTHKQTVGVVSFNDVTKHLIVSSPLPYYEHIVILYKAFSVPSSLPYLSFTYEPPTQVLTCLAFLGFIIFIHIRTSKCDAKHFGINPTLSYYFLLLFLPILVLSFCYNRIFLMGGFPFLCIVLPSSCHSPSVVLIS